MTTETSQDIQRILLEFICTTYLVEEDEFEVDKSLVDQGIIDSFGLVEISAFLTETFGFSVAETEMNRENFGSVENLVSFVARKIGSCP